jgi:hypothetical protein
MGLIRRILFAALSFIGLATWLAGNQASATSRPDIHDFARRAEMVREKLELLADQERASPTADASEKKKLAQWLNWPNWPNWQNWQNWSNYRR